jgi:Contact-dependent growth inhibition CdiA C-terminal domain
MGYRVEQHPPKTSANKTPDFRIEGEYFDNYHATTPRVRNMTSELKRKVDKDGVYRFVIDLRVWLETLGSA